MSTLRQAAKLLGIFLFVSVLSTLPGWAQSNPSPPPAASTAGNKSPAGEVFFPDELRTTVTRSRSEIERLAKSVERVKRSDRELELLRPEIDAIYNSALRAEQDLEPLIEGVKRQLTALGEPPKEGEPAETASVAVERARLNQSLAQLQGASKQSDLTRVRAQQLLRRIQALRLENLDRDLRQRRDPPASSAHWEALYAALPRFGGQIQTIAENWWSLAWPRLHWLLLILGGATVVWWRLSIWCRARIRKWLDAPLETSPPAYILRVQMALRTLPVLMLPGLATMAIFYVALVAAGLVSQQSDGIILSAVKSLALFLVTLGLAKAILLPWDHDWRLIGIPTDRSRRYLRLIYLIAGVYCLDLWFSEVFTALHVPVAIRVTETLLANLSFAALLFLFAWTPLLPHETFDDRVSARLAQRTIQWLRLPASLAVVGIIAATLLGYYALGRFIAGQVMLFGIGAAILLLGHLATRSIAQDPATLGPGVNDVLDKRLALNEPRRVWFFSLLSLFLNVLLVVVAGAFILLSWGYSSGELAGWGKSLIFGFEIGEYRFSLVRVSIAVGIFAGVILVTKAIQAWLATKALNPEHMDRGVANSIRSGIGYAGMLVATLFAVSFAGLDLSNFAIFASALTIAVGFGVNAIAGNFVSGLIMLVERPIKVGDWVVVGAHQGYVRHISVRATEIETFDRASVIIPNSDFMTNAVQNWTHRNSMARVLVTIGASYNADPEQVMEVLDRVAKENEHLLKYPAPSVHFDEFGASSLDFSVRGYIADVNSMLTAKTSLRLAIAKAFKEARIEIPYPQQDVHLRDLDGVKELVGEAMARRAAELRTETTAAPAEGPSKRNEG